MVRGGGCTAGALEAHCCWFADLLSAPSKRCYYVLTQGASSLAASAIKYMIACCRRRDTAVYKAAVAKIAAVQTYSVPTPPSPPDLQAAAQSD
jgi:hypothetical protein